MPEVTQPRPGQSWGAKAGRPPLQSPSPHLPPPPPVCPPDLTHAGVPTWQHLGRVGVVFCGSEEDSRLVTLVQITTLPPSWSAAMSGRNGTECDPSGGATPRNGGRRESRCGRVWVLLDTVGLRTGRFTAPRRQSWSQQRKARRDLQGMRHRLGLLISPLTRGHISLFLKRSEIGSLQGVWAVVLAAQAGPPSPRPSSVGPSDCWGQGKGL